MTEFARKATSLRHALERNNNEHVITTFRTVWRNCMLKLAFGMAYFVTALTSAYP